MNERIEIQASFIDGFTCWKRQMPLLIRQTVYKKYSVMSRLYPQNSFVYVSFLHLFMSLSWFYVAKSFSVKHSPARCMEESHSTASPLCFLEGFSDSLLLEEVLCCGDGAEKS